MTPMQQLAIAALIIGTTLVAKAATDNRIDTTYACLATLISIHSDGSPSIQSKPQAEKSPFKLQIRKKAQHDSLWCDSQTKPTGMLLAYCNAPFEAQVDGNYFYGDDTTQFRGHIATNYFFLFPDNHFLWSHHIGDGVVIQTGVCKSN